MSFKNSLTKFWAKIEDLILTNHACLSCRREIADGSEFSMCENCLKSLDEISGNICKLCGERILEDNNYCDSCKNIKFNFDQSRSFVYYSDTAANIIKRFKYSSKKYYAKHIAMLMSKNKPYFEGVDLLTFVPIGSKRKKEMGFNQAEELAICLGEFLDIPVVDVLKKEGSERHQAGLSQTERQENLSGSIVFKDDIGKVLNNKTVMIIDDVFTTGSTLSECARVIKSARANKPRKVLCYTFAKTIFNSTNNSEIQQNN